MTETTDHNDGRTAQEVREYLLTHLNGALRRPGMYGGETALRLYFDAVAFADAAEQAWREELKDLQARRASFSTGVRGAFQDLWGDAHEGAVASVLMRVRRSSNGPPVHCSLECFHPVHVALDHTRTPLKGESGGDGVEVLAEEAGEALHRLGGVLFGLADPLQKKVSTPVTDEIGERAGEVAGPGDVRAGEPDLQQPLVLALGEGLAGPHDP
jgi:hypothetical protein